MKLSLAVSLLALAASGQAQTAPNFPGPRVNTTLGVTYVETNTNVTPPGVLLDRSRLLSTPAIIAPGFASRDARHIVFMIDQDVPGGNNNNDNDDDDDDDDDGDDDNARTTLLHWFQPNLVLFGNATNTSLAVATSNVSGLVGASYVPPNPPQGSGAHQYTFPANFTVPSNYSRVNPAAEVSARRGFNLNRFAAAAGLGSPLAATYLRVLNGSGTESSTAATATGTPGPTTAAAGAGGSTATTTGGSGTAATATSRAAAVDLGGRSQDALSGLVMGVAGAVLWML